MSPRFPRKNRIASGLTGTSRLRHLRYTVPLIRPHRSIILNPFHFHLRHCPDDFSHACFGHECGPAAELDHLASSNTSSISRRRHICAHSCPYTASVARKATRRRPAFHAGRRAAAMSDDRQIREKLGEMGSLTGRKTPSIINLFSKFNV